MRLPINDKPTASGDKPAFSDAVIVEIYPDKGYPTTALTLGGFAGADVMNSEGISVSAYEDDTYGVAHSQKDYTRSCGISFPQVMVLIANT